MFKFNFGGKKNSDKIIIKEQTISDTVTVYYKVKNS